LKIYQTFPIWYIYIPVGNTGQQKAIAQTCGVAQMK